MTTPRDELIAIQKRLVEELKERVYDHVGRNDPVMDRYYRDYQAEFKPGFERPASRDEIIQQLARAQLAYFGDYHTLRSAQSAVLDLLGEVARRHEKKLVLCVEMLHAEHNHLVQAHLDNEMDSVEFRRQVHWTTSWNFPWASWGRFFEFAREHKAPLYGVNLRTEGRPDSLQHRDSFAAGLVSALTLLHPDRLIAVVYGDLHMAQGHLPAAVQGRLETFGAQRRAVRVYQNSETVYWLLVGRQIEHVVDYVKLKRDVYVLMNATPLVKFQSFLNWQHQAQELAGRADDSDTDSENLLLEQIHDHIRTITEFLGISLPETANFEVYTPNDLDFLQRLVERGVYSEGEMAALKSYIAMTDSAFFERAHVLYLGNLSVANAAEAAARYVLSELRPESREPVVARDEFYARCMVEALAFFCSKIIDHRRVARDETTWREVLDRVGRRRKLGVAQRIDASTARGYLRHKEYERQVLATGGYGSPPRGLFGLPAEQHVALTRALGRALGEMIYHGVSEGRVSKELVRQAMQDDVREPDRSRMRYFQFLRLALRWRPTAKAAKYRKPVAEEE
ncbi:MAG: ChaN family lipoprotein [Planctomycetes bacterium]|nr:ChaN family lipoprotein [Planctomycetota bacterium]